VNSVLSAKPPAWFWIVSVILLIWNGFGVFQYLLFSFASPEQIAQNFTEEEFAIVATMPAWVTGAFAIAVFAGLVACLGLLTKKMWARSLFVLSLIAVLVEHFWTFFLSGYLDIMPATAVIGPLAVVIVGIFEIWLANKGIKRGWLR
jgi:hypothetical protein